MLTYNHRPLYRAVPLGEARSPRLAAKRLTPPALSGTINVPASPSRPASPLPSVGPFQHKESPTMLTRTGVRCLLGLVALVLTARAHADPPQGQPAKLIVYPPQITLNGPRDEQRVGVLGVYADGRMWDLSRDAKYTIAENTATVTPAGLVPGASDGQPTLSVEAGGAKVVV